MGRSNRRASEHEPLNIDALNEELDAFADRQIDQHEDWMAQQDDVPVYMRLRRETDAEQQARLNAASGRRRRRTDERIDARIQAHFDTVGWRECMVPECPEPARSDELGSWRRRQHDVTKSLPLCTRHLVLIASTATNSWYNPDVVAAREQFARKVVAEEIERDRKADLAFESAGATQGQIYFVRLNGLIKVGWSSKLRSRLKSYGASAEILCHYPASRQEETDLHRSLRPYLARGREWYQDCRLIADMVNGLVEKHGQPTLLPGWTEPKPDVVGKRNIA